MRNGPPPGPEREEWLAEQRRVDREFPVFALVMFLLFLAVMSLAGMSP